MAKLQKIINKGATIYAKALFNAVANLKIANLQEDKHSDNPKQLIKLYLNDFKNLLATNQDLFYFFNSQIISQSQYRDFLNALAPAYAKSQVFINFLYILAEKKRLKYLDQIAQAFEDLCHKEQNIMTISVFSAKKLETEISDKIITILNKKFNKTIKLNQEIDKTLLAGFKLQINTNMIDLSTIGHINNITHLMKEA